MAVDSFYETIGKALYKISTNSIEKSETQAMARGLVLSIQNISFLCLLKLYRKIFEHCAPIINMMQKPTLDAVKVRSMLDDFQRFLAALDFDQIWNVTLEADPDFPIMHARAEWRGTESANNGSQESWEQTLSIVQEKICTKFLKQISWGFQNLEKWK